MGHDRLRVTVIASMLLAIAWMASCLQNPIKVLIPPELDHNVQFMGVKYDTPQKGQSTWFYSVTSGESAAIDSVALGVPTSLEIVDAGEWNRNFDQRSTAKFQVVAGDLPSTRGLLFGSAFTTSETRHYYFTVNRNAARADLNFKVISVGRLYMDDTTGPGDGEDHGDSDSEDCGEIQKDPAAIKWNKDSDTELFTIHARFVPCPDDDDDDDASSTDDDNGSDTDDGSSDGDDGSSDDNSGDGGGNDDEGDDASSGDDDNGSDTDDTSSSGDDGSSDDTSDTDGGGEDDASDAGPTGGGDDGDSTDQGGSTGDANSGDVGERNPARQGFTVTLENPGQAPFVTLYIAPEKFEERRNGKKWIYKHVQDGATVVVDIEKVGNRRTMYAFTVKADVDANPGDRRIITRVAIGSQWNHLDRTWAGEIGRRIYLTSAMMEDPTRTR